jgi:hypothetical protein
MARLGGRSRIRNLTLTHSVIGEMAGVVGAIALGSETVLAHESLA